MENRRPNNYWTKEKCIEIAKECKTISNMQKLYSGAYTRARKNGWLEDLRKVTIPARKINIYWTREKCLEKIKICKTRTEFSTKYPGAYNAILKNNWKDLLENIILVQKTWNFDLCKIEALKYNSRTEFARKCPSAYDHAKKNKFLDSICMHMQVKGHAYARLIYKLYDDVGNVYIGLSCNPKRRLAEHKRSDKFKKVFKSFNMEVLTEFLSPKEAIAKEREFIEFYKKSDLNIINIASGGSLGGVRNHNKKYML